MRVQALGETPRARPTAAWHATPANFSWRVHAPHKLAAVPTGTTHPKAVFCWRCAHTNGARDPTIAHAPQCALRAARTSARPNRWACSQIYARMQLCARKRCERAPASLRCARATAQTRRETPRERAGPARTQRPRGMPCVVPGLRSGARWGPRTGAAGPAAILCVRQLGSQALLFAPQWARIGNQGTVGNRYLRGMSIPPAHNRSPPCIVIIQYTAYRVGALPPLTSVSW